MTEPIEVLRLLSQQRAMLATDDEIADVHRRGWIEAPAFPFHLTDEGRTALSAGVFDAPATAGPPPPSPLAKTKGLRGPKRSKPRRKAKASR